MTQIPNQNWPEYERRGAGGPSRQPANLPDDRLVFRPIFVEREVPTRPDAQSEQLRTFAHRVRAIVALVFVVIALAIAFARRHDIEAFLAKIDDIGSGSPDAQMKGLLSFGLVVVSLLAALRIVLDSKRK